MFLRVQHLTLAGFRFFSRKHGLLSNTNLREIKSGNFGRPSRSGPFVIDTLDPNKFDEKKQQLFYIGDQRTFRPRISLHKHPNLVIGPNITYKNHSVKAPFSRFPPGSKAFLYYSMPPGKPRIAGELRLRVASSDDLASFENGSDLLLTDGQPWSRPLCVLSKYYSPLYEKLREDRLVSDDLHTVLSTLPSIKPLYRRSHLLYTLNDTFIVDFRNVRLTFLVITEQGVELLPLLKLFSDYREMHMGIPYTGSALVRFERSTFPEDDGTRTVVLRFLKIITPVKSVMPLYDGYICCPKEGELHRKSRYTSTPVLNPPIWSVNIDKPKGAMTPGFRLLWDT